MLEVMKSLQTTLNKITVSGKENLDMMLGCMMTIEKIITILEGGDDHANDQAEQRDCAERE